LTYIPEKKLAIEIDGIYWHSELNGKGSSYHLNKTKECEELGIQLIHIFEDEIIHNKDTVYSAIAAKLGLISNKIGARKCQIQKLNVDTERDFINKYHLMKYTPSNVAYGLYYEDELQMVCTFGKSRFTSDEWEIIRICTKHNIIVQGGISKLITFFKENNKITNLISYADRRWCNIKNNAYVASGMKLINISKPGYWYLDFSAIKRKHRYNFTKRKIIEELDGDPELSEWENMIDMGHDRIWDCGQLKFSI